MNSKHDSIITRNEVSHKLIPELPKDTTLPDSIVLAASESLKKSYPSLFSKARKSLEGARKRSGQPTVIQTQNAPSFLSKAELSEACKGLGYHPSDELLEFARVKILDWLGTSKATSDIFRIWAKKFRNAKSPTKHEGPQKPNPSPVRKEAGDE